MIQYKSVQFDHNTLVKLEFKCSSVVIVGIKLNIHEIIMVSFSTFLFAIFRSGTKCKQSNQEKKIVSDDWHKRPRLSLRHHMDWMRENIRRRANKVGSRFQVILRNDSTVYTLNFYQNH